MLNFIRRQRLKELTIKLAGAQAQHADLQKMIAAIKTVSGDLIYSSASIAARIGELEAEIEYIKLKL